MTPRVIVLPAARADLAEQYDYLVRDSVNVADRFLAAAEAAFEQLVQMPGIGAPRRLRNVRLAGLRQWAIRGFENYLIFYRVTDQRIEIVRVLHGARDVRRILEAEEPE